MALDGGRTVAGVAVGVALTPLLGLAAGLLAGWGVAAVIVVVAVLAYTWPMDPQRTREHASREDPGRRVARLVSIAGSVASLGAVAVVLFQTGTAPLGESAILAAIAVFSVAASWFLIQTNYMLRYAHEYFEEPAGGIDFHGAGSADVHRLHLLRRGTGHDVPGGRHQRARATASGAS